MCTHYQHFHNHTTTVTSVTTTRLRSGVFLGWQPQGPARPQQVSGVLIWSFAFICLWLPSVFTFFVAVEWVSGWMLFLLMGGCMSLCVCLLWLIFLVVTWWFPFFISVYELDVGVTIPIYYSTTILILFNNNIYILPSTHTHSHVDTSRVRCPSS